MSTRDKEVLNMQLVLGPVLAEAWKKSNCWNNGALLIKMN